MSVPQLPLALRYPPDQRFETFVGSEATARLLSESARGGRDDWLMLSGPSGCGKTHLLLAACADAVEAGRRAVYLDLDRVGQVGHGLADALDGLDGNDLVCLDRLDAVAGQRAAEIALFDFHNRARSGSAVLVYAARVVPAALDLALPDLRSRLGQCTQVSVAMLDDQGRRAVLVGRAHRRGLNLDEPVLDYLFARVGRDLAGLARLLDRLDRESLAAGRRITVPFVRDLLARETQARVVPAGEAAAGGAATGEAVPPDGSPTDT